MLTQTTSLPLTSRSTNPFAVVGDHGRFQEGHELLQLHRLVPVQVYVLEHHLRVAASIAV